MKPSPSALTSYPPCRSTWRRTRRLWKRNNPPRLVAQLLRTAGRASMSEKTIVNVPPPVAPSGSATAASATRSIELRRTSSSGSGGSRLGITSSWHEPKVTTCPNCSGVGRCTGTPSTSVPFVLPRSSSVTRPPTELRRRCRRDKSASVRSKPSQSWPISIGRCRRRCSGVLPGSVIWTRVDSTARIVESGVPQIVNNTWSTPCIGVSAPSPSATADGGASCSARAFRWGRRSPWGSLRR